MTLPPLFLDREPCGCETALGHVCRPPFASAENWPGRAELRGCNSIAPDKIKGTNTKVSPRPRKRSGDVTTTVRSDRDMSISASSPTSVYRYYDRFGVLIYVGVTSRRTSRQHEHNLDKDWWQYVDHQTVEHFNTRVEALSRESELIGEFRPPFNTQQNPDSATSAKIYVAFRDSMREPSPWYPGSKLRVDFVPFSRSEDEKLTVVRSVTAETEYDQFSVATGLKASSDKRKYGRVAKAWMHGPFIFVKVVGKMPPLISASASFTFRKKDRAVYIESFHVWPEYHIPREKKVR